MKFADLTTTEQAAALIRKLDQLRADRERREAPSPNREREQLTRKGGRR